MIKNGTKIMLTKEKRELGFIGEIFEVVDIDGDYIHYTNDDSEFVNIMKVDTMMEYFDILRGSDAKEENNEAVIMPTVTEEDVVEILENSSFTVNTVFDKCTIVSVQLPNGFVITESSACVCPENYDECLGVEICINRIKDKIWELEGYRLQQDLFEMECCETCECECSECDLYNECYK